VIRKITTGTRIIPEENCKYASAKDKGSHWEPLSFMNNLAVHSLLKNIFMLKYYKQIFTVVFIMFGQFAYAQSITTVAGNGDFGFTGDGGPATAASFNNVQGLDVDSTGNIFIADPASFRIRRVDTSGIINIYAGTTFGYSGDGGPALSAKFGSTTDVAVDKHGNIYVCDEYNYRIRMVNTTGIITTIAGNGISGYSGDGGFATSALLKAPGRIAVDDTGNVFIVDFSRIRKINTSGIISTIAGDTVFGYSGDDGPAVNALITPLDIATDHRGNLYISDNQTRIRRITPDGMINTIAGNGTAGFSGDGGPAVAAEFNDAEELGIDHQNNLYISDDVNYRIRKVDTNNIISTVIGNGNCGYSGDGGPVDSAVICGPGCIAFDGNDNLYFYDHINNIIRKVTYPAPVDTTTAVHYITITKSISISPNPASDNITISGLNAGDNVTLYNMMGMQMNIGTANNGNYSLARIPADMYILFVRDKQGNVRKRQTVSKL